MGIFLFGVYFLILATLHHFGNQVFLPKKHKNTATGRQFQKGLVFPFAFLGIAWIILGMIYLAHGMNDTLSFYIWFLILTLIPLLLLIRNKRTHR